MDDMLTFYIDLNMLRGDRVRSHVEFLETPFGRRREPSPGETVYAVDEDGARYFAVIETVQESGFVELSLKFESRVRVKGSLEISSGEKFSFSPQENNAGTKAFEPARNPFVTA